LTINDSVDQLLPMPKPDASLRDEPDAALDRVFAALADPVRRAILRRLDGRDLLVSELAEPFAISLQAVSRHIQVLVRAGLVTQERTGRISRCRLDAGPIYQAAVWVNRYSKYWQSQFDTLAAWLAEISSEGREHTDAISGNRQKTGRVPAGDRRAARKNANAATPGRARRGRKLPLRDE
jgi:DNA-binding transcriptional ArsR family regulator